MIVNSALAGSYGEALFQAALKAGVAEQIARQAKAVSELILKETKFVAFMEAPNIARDAKEAVFVKAFGPQFHPLLINFARLLIRRGRLELLFTALEFVQERYREHTGVRSAVVMSAVELSADAKARLQAVLNEHTGKTLEINWRIDPSVIGGLQFRSGDILIDTTLSNALRLLSADLKSAQVI